MSFPAKRCILLMYAAFAGKILHTHLGGGGQAIRGVCVCVCVC